MSRNDEDIFLTISFFVLNSLKCHLMFFFLPWMNSDVCLRLITKLITKLPTFPLSDWWILFVALRCLKNFPSSATFFPGSTWPGSICSTTNAISGHASKLNTFYLFRPELSSCFCYTVKSVFFLRQSLDFKILKMLLTEMKPASFRSSH